MLDFCCGLFEWSSPILTFYYFSHFLFDFFLYWGEGGMQQQIKEKYCSWSPIKKMRKNERIFLYSCNNLMKERSISQYCVSDLPAQNDFGEDKHCCFKLMFSQLIRCLFFSIFNILFGTYCWCDFWYGGWKILALSSIIIVL